MGMRRMEQKPRQKHTVRAIFRAIANVKRSARESPRNHPQPPTTHPLSAAHRPLLPLAWVSLLLFLLLLVLLLPLLLSLDQKKKCFA